MDRIRIRGGRPLSGDIVIGGAKNAALPLMAAALLTDQRLVLSNVPRLADVQIQGLRFVPFDQTAWDLALTTQALTYIDRDLAFDLSRVYSEQKFFGELTRGMTQAIYLIPMQDNFDAFAQAAEAYYGDAVFLEPKMIEEYDQLILHIDRVLGR